MPLADEDQTAAPVKPPTHTVGQALDTLSADELAERVQLLHTEIARLEDARVAKLASKTAAAAFFKSP